MFLQQYFIKFVLTCVYYIYPGPGGDGRGLDTGVPRHPDAVLPVPIPQPA